MVFAVTDLDGNVVGLYRMPDATIFSIDVAVAKARNVAYYANPRSSSRSTRSGRAAGVGVHQPHVPLPRRAAVPGGHRRRPAGAVLAAQRRPVGTDRFTGRQVGAPLPASAYQSVVGYDSFNPGTNFHARRPA